jgi:chaperonin GroES
MGLRPIGDRVLVKPEKAPEQTESGLWLSEHRKPENMGTVVAVGPCPHPLKHEASTLAQKLECLAQDGYAYGEHTEAFTDAANMLRDVTRREPSVKVGDDVLFSWTVGQEITVDDERYLLMRETDILAVVEN